MAMTNEGAVDSFAPNARKKPAILRTTSVIFKMVLLKSMYYVYILQCKDGSLYTGIAVDVEKRFKQHRAGKGGHYTRAHPPQKILYREKAATRSAALKREAAIKKLPRAKKLAL